MMPISRLLLLPLLAASLLAEDAVIPSSLVVEPPTLICLGFEWPIDGDENRNSSVEVQYRKKGAGEWSDALPLLRIGGEEAGTPELEYVTPHMFAGSILDLAPDTEYEARLVMSDPDGVRGEAVQVVTVKTRGVPQGNSGGPVRHVYPQDWKGDKEEPAYDGLLHAYYGFKRFADWNLTTDAVRPGDTIVIHAGLYKADRFDYRDYHGVTFHGSYRLTVDGTEERPVVIKAAGDGEVIFDGNGSYSVFDVQAADHNYLEGITIRNAEVAIYAGAKDVLGPVGLVVRKCRIDNVGIGIMAQYQGSKNFYIADNVILGRADRTKLVRQVEQPDGSRQQRVESYYGVKVYGQGHVICHNYVAYFFDGVDVCTHGRPELRQDHKSVAIDIYNNDIHLMNDNAIEADGGTHNIRVLRNRAFNTAQGVLTAQPVLGGPAYFIRNIIYNVSEKPVFKWWGMRPAGVLAYHNTAIAQPARRHKPVSNAHFRNNLFVGPDGSEIPVLGLQTYTGYTSFDYNGYRMAKGKTAPFIWHSPREGVAQDAKLEHAPLEFDTLDEFRAATGQERHGVLLDIGSFVEVPLPSSESLGGKGLEFPLYSPEGMDFRLSEGSPAVDAGQRLPNINDGFAGSAPDLGALETNRPAPHYGPRGVPVPERRLNPMPPSSGTPAPI